MVICNYVTFFKSPTPQQLISNLIRVVCVCVCLFLAVGDTAAAVKSLLLVSFINPVFNYLDVIVFTGEEAGEGAKDQLQPNSILPMQTFGDHVEKTVSMSFCCKQRLRVLDRPSLF